MLFSLLFHLVRLLGNLLHPKWGRKPRKRTIRDPGVSRWREIPRRNLSKWKMRTHYLMGLASGRHYWKAIGQMWEQLATKTSEQIFKNYACYWLQWKAKETTGVVCSYQFTLIRDSHIYIEMIINIGYWPEQMITRRRKAIGMGLPWWSSG